MLLLVGKSKYSLKSILISAVFIPDEPSPPLFAYPSVPAPPPPPFVTYPLFPKK